MTVVTKTFWYIIIMSNSHFAKLLFQTEKNTNIEYCIYFQGNFLGDFHSYTSTNISALSYNVHDLSALSRNNVTQAKIRNFSQPDRNSTHNTSNLQHEQGNESHAWDGHLQGEWAQPQDRTACNWMMLTVLYRIYNGFVIYRRLQSTCRRWNKEQSTDHTQVDVAKLCFVRNQPYFSDW